MRVRRARASRVIGQRGWIEDTAGTGEGARLSISIALLPGLVFILGFGFSRTGVSAPHLVELGRACFLQLFVQFGDVFGFELVPG
jgi:hypothetical protein